MKRRSNFGPIAVAIVIVLCASQVALAQVEWTWVGSGPVVQPGPPGSWDDGRHWVGDVVFDGTTYHMYLTGGSGNSGLENQWSVGHWTSSDIQGPWQPDPLGNPVLEPDFGQWDSYSITTLAVHFDGAVFHMWYGAYDGHHGPARGGYATSGDGSVWTKYAGNPLPGLEPGLPGTWDEYGVFPSAVLFDGSIYRMWYIGWGGDPDPWAAPHAIGYAISANGIDWSKRPDPVLEATVSWEGNKVYDPEVVPWGDGFAMWYSGASTSGSSIGYAVSPGDPEFGVDWRKWTGNPVITPVGVGCNVVDSTAVIIEGDVLHASVSNCWDDIWHLTSSPLDAASFFDGFESGDTSVWEPVVP